MVPLYSLEFLVQYNITLHPSGVSWYLTIRLTRFSETWRNSGKQTKDFLKVTKVFVNTICEAFTRPYLDCGNIPYHDEYSKSEKKQCNTIFYLALTGIISRNYMENIF